MLKKLSNNKWIHSFALKHFILSLFQYEKRVICLEIMDSHITVLGLLKGKNEIYTWLNDRLVIPNSDDNFIKTGLQEAINVYPEIKHYQIVYLWPGLKTIYRNELDGDTSPSFMSMLNSADFKAVELETGNKTKLRAFAKNSDLENIENLFDEIGLNLAGIYKGNLEWIYTYLVRNPIKFSGEQRFAYIDEQFTLDILFKDGICNNIQIQSSIPAPVSLSKESEYQGYACICNRNGGKGMIPDISDEYETDWKDPGIVAANGVALSHYYTQFSSFNFLSKKIHEKVKYKGIEKKIQKILVLITGMLIILNFLLLIPSIIIDSKHSQLLAQKQTVETQITKINQFEAENKNLTDQYEKLVLLQSQKTRIGRAMYCVSQVIPQDTWLENMNWGDTRMNRQADADKLFIEGYSKKQLSVITFIESMKDEPLFDQVSLDNYDTGFEKRPGSSKDKAGIHFLISARVVQ